MVPERIAALPCWQGRLTGEPLKGGLSNEIWKVTDDAGVHVVRLGPDYPVHHVFRAREAMTARAAHRAGFAPAVHYTAPGVMVTAFVTGNAWDGARVRTEAAAVGRLLAEFHRRMAEEVEGAAFLFWPFHVVRDYARTLRTGESPWLGDLPRFLSLNASLEATQPPLPLVFGHNDLLPANFLDDGARLWLIDYEYAGFSTAMFDLAGVASNAVMSQDEAAALLTAYLGHAPDAAFLRAFDAMQVESLLREAMWAMVSELHLSAPGVDYTAYARENLSKLDAALDRYQSRHGRLT
jgi:thiamine kinase-like enzyme